jgi:uncharacterized OB-fold protein
VASDCRIGAPGSALERNFGDGAAAFLVGDSDVALAFEDSHAISDEIVDVWRADADRFVHSWEERFVVQHGYRENLSEAVRELLARSDASPGDFARVVLYGPDARSHAALARTLGFSAEQLEDPLFGRLGNTGAAFVPMLLAAALERLGPGERVLVGGYGDGAEALTLRATEHARKLGPRRGVSWHLARRAPLASYATSLKARGLQPTEYAPGSDPGLSATIHFRERDEDISFKGQRCRVCGATQFPNQRVCASCFAKDDFDLVRLSDRGGRVLTYTLDYFFPTPSPPTVVTVTEVDGGARVHLQLADASADDVRLDLPVEFSFRRMHEVGGRPNYYWKCVPRSDPPDAAAAAGAEEAT